MRSQCILKKVVYRCLKCQECSSPQQYQLKFLLSINTLCRYKKLKIFFLLKHNPGECVSVLYTKALLKDIWFIFVLNNKN